MRLYQEVGVWELFIPRLAAGEVYKYEILGQQGLLPLKAAPLALATEKPCSLLLELPPLGTLIIGVG